MIGKKGQKIESPTVHVAIFVLLLGLIIIAYLVLLPRTEREKLLGTGEEYYPEGYEEEEEGEVEREILLSEYPGEVYPYSREIDDKSLASVNLYSTTRTKPVMLADKVIVSRSLFINNYKELSFDVEGFDDLNNLGLFFNTGDANGDLVVILNGNEVYRGRVRGGDLPIELPYEHLKKFNNQLIFESSHPGLFILSKNRFTLKDVQLIKQIDLVNKVEMRNFVVDNLESLRKGELGFFVNCLKVNVEQGTLKVGLNGRQVYIGRVVCDAREVEIDLLKNYFVDGRNTLTFEIDTGEYILEQVDLDLDVEAKKEPKYYFVVDEVEGKYTLKMNFVESDEIKRATISVNGENVYLADYGNFFKKDITSLIREGENYVRISAKNEFVIDLLEIVKE